MKLIVTDRDVETSFDEVILTIDEFCDIHNHPYIATANFDSIVVDLDSKIPDGYFTAIIGKFKVIPRVFEPYTTDTVRLLSELYKEEGPRLRFTWLKNKGDLSGIVKELSDKFEWDSFY